MALSETQLALHLTPKEVYQFDNYYFAKPELEHAVKTFCNTDSINFLFLVGPDGVGKTHLLTACAEYFDSLGKSIRYLSFAEIVKTNQPNILLSIEQSELICLDDIDEIIGQKEWEEAVFHLFNRLREADRKIVMSSHQSPSQMALSLADLRSRLAMGLVYQINTMDDEQKQQALIKRAKLSGLTMNKEVAQFLLRHQSRDMKALIEIMHKLDKASLEEQRRLTIPFVKQVLSFEL